MAGSLNKTRDRERPNQGDVTLFCFLIYPSLGNSPNRSVFTGLFPRASSFSSPHNSLIRCEWICLFWGGPQIDYWALTCLTWARTINKSGLFSVDLLAGGGEGITACRLWESLPLGKWDILNFSFYITRVFACVNTSLWFLVNQREWNLCVHSVFWIETRLVHWDYKTTFVPGSYFWKCVNILVSLWFGYRGCSVIFQDTDFGSLRPLLFMLLCSIEFAPMTDVLLSQKWKHRASLSKLTMGIWTSTNAFGLCPSSLCQGSLNGNSG